MWSAPVVLSGPMAEPVTLADAKAFVSVDADESSFDALISAFVAAAREQVEAVCGIYAAPVSVRVDASCWADLARLPVAPVSAITGIVWDDADGAAQTLAATVYELAGTGLAPAIRLKPGQSWPAGLRAGEGVIRVTLAAGYADLPGPLWTAIQLMAADLFAHRETAVVGTVAAKVPTSMQVDHLIANFRRWA